MDFEKTYETCFQNVYRFACSLTGDGRLAEEVTQEEGLWDLGTKHDPARCPGCAR